MRYLLTLKKDKIAKILNIIILKIILYLFKNRDLVMQSILNLSIPTLSFLFEQISTTNPKVIWIRDPAYQQQLYVNSCYEQIWGRSCEQLYNYPLSWNDTLVCPDKENIIEKNKLRSPQKNEPFATSFFSIHDLQGNIKFIKDACFFIFNATNQQIAVAGISEVITASEWDEAKKPKKSAPSQENTIHLLTEKLQITTSIPAKQAFPLNNNQLTERESLCLHHLMLGQSSKQIARILSISPRTIEGHIHNIKNKLGCKTRIELLSKVNNAG